MDLASSTGRKKCDSILVTCIMASDSTHVPLGKLMLTKCYSNICCFVCALPMPASWTNFVVVFRMILFVPLYGCVINIDCICSLIIAPCRPCLAMSSKLPSQSFSSDSLVQGMKAVANQQVKAEPDLKDMQAELQD